MGMAAIDFQLLADAGFPPATFKPGETIFAAGDKGDKMYVIRGRGRDRAGRQGRREARTRRNFRRDGADRWSAAGRHSHGKDGL